MRKPRYKPDQKETHLHLMTRTAHKRKLMDDTFKENVVVPAILAYSDVFYVRLHTYVAMGNHFHIVLTIRKPERDDEDLKRRFQALQLLKSRPERWSDERAEGFYNRLTDFSKFMQSLNWRIAWTYNHQRELAEGESSDECNWGHFWGARYNSVVLEDDRAIERLCSYVEQNAVQAGLVEKPSDYRWCLAGKLRAQMEEESSLCRPRVEAPEVGMFRRYEAGIERDTAYINFNDRLAVLIRDPKKRTELPPPEIIALSINEAHLKQTIEDINTRRPCAWRYQVLGSEEYEKAIGEALAKEAKKRPP